MATRRLFDGAQIEIKSIPIVGQSSTPAAVFYIKVSGVWKAAITWIKVSGVWKQATPFVKIGGQFR
jgi:hypothetical protein